VRDGGSFSVAILDLASGNRAHRRRRRRASVGADSRHLIFADGGSLLLSTPKPARKTTVASGFGKKSPSPPGRAKKPPLPPIASPFMKPTRFLPIALAALLAFTTTACVNGKKKPAAAAARKATS